MQSEHGQQCEQSSKKFKKENKREKKKISKQNKKVQWHKPDILGQIHKSKNFSFTINLAPYV